MSTIIDWILWCHLGCGLEFWTLVRIKQVMVVVVGLLLIFTRESHLTRGRPSALPIRIVKASMTAVCVMLFFDYRDDGYARHTTIILFFGCVSALICVQAWAAYRFFPEERR